LLVSGAGDDDMVGDSRTTGGTATGGGIDTIFGGDGNDHIAGDSLSLRASDAIGGGRDYLDGGNGNDTIVGDSVARKTAIGAGNDVLLGGAGTGDLLIGDSEGRPAGDWRPRRRFPGPGSGRRVRRHWRPFY
jgi:Ca2+-binding RTX toxin-like protein